MPAARRDQTTLIDDDLRAFVHGPVSVMLGSADRLQVPDATRIAGLAALDDHHLRVLIGADARAARSNVVPGAPVAILVTDITTYRSVQWKGTVVSCEPRTPGDAALAHRHLEAFRAASSIVGIDPAKVHLLFPVELIAVVVAVDDLFDQTPGAAAGHRIEAGG